MSKKGVEFIPPIEEVRAKYKEAVKGIRYFKPYHRKVSAFLDRWVQTNFRTQGGKVGSWEPFIHGGRIRTKKGETSGLAVSLLLNRRRVYVDGSAVLLQDTGRLRSSFLPFHDDNKAGIGSDLPYAKPHDKGGNPWPIKRRILPEERDATKDVLKIADRHIKSELKKAKLK